MLASQSIKRMNNFGDNIHAVGRFDLLARFWRNPEMPAGLPLHAGALTCPVAAPDLASLPQDFSRATITFENTQLGPHPIIEMTLSVGDQEIRWLADAKDPDVWANIYIWKQWKVMPVVVGVEQGTGWVYRFYLPEMPVIALTPGEMIEPGYVWGDTEPWLSMLEHIKSHRAAYPLMSARVPPVPRPDELKGVKVVLSPEGL